MNRWTRSVVWMVGLCLLFTAVAQAGRKQSLKPYYVEYHGGADISGVPVPPEPQVYVYAYLGNVPDGAVMGVNVYSEFSPYSTELWIRGKKVGAVIPRVRAFPLPQGVSPLIPPEVSADVQAFVLHEAGTWGIEVRVFLTPRNYWSFKFDLVVEAIEFYGFQCLGLSDTVDLRYQLFVLGQLPGSVTVTIKGTEFGDLAFWAAVDSDGVAEFSLSAGFYQDALGGRFLETVVKDNSSGDTAIGWVFYTPFESLFTCGFEKG